MTTSELFFTILGSAGGASILIIGLSAWLGKVWATRITQREVEILKSKLTQQQAWYKSEIDRIQKIHTQRYTILQELAGMVADYNHFAMRVAEGSGRNLRGDATTYCEELDRLYWTLRNYVRQHQLILKDEIYYAIYSLTDTGRPLKEDCNSSNTEEEVKPQLISVKWSDINKEVMKVNALIDQSAMELERPNTPPNESDKCQVMNRGFKKLNSFISAK